MDSKQHHQSQFKYPPIISAVQTDIFDKQWLNVLAHLKRFYDQSPDNFVKQDLPNLFFFFLCGSKPSCYPQLYECVYDTSIKSLNKKQLIATLIARFIIARESNIQYLHNCDIIKLFRMETIAHLVTNVNFNSKELTGHPLASMTNYLVRWVKSNGFLNVNLRIITQVLQHFIIDGIGHKSAAIMSLIMILIKPAKTQHDIAFNLWSCFSGEDELSPNCEYLSSLIFQFMFNVTNEETNVKYLIRDHIHKTLFVVSPPLRHYILKYEEYRRNSVHTPYSPHVLDTFKNKINCIMNSFLEENKIEVTKKDQKKDKLNIIHTKSVANNDGQQPTDTTECTTPRTNGNDIDTNGTNGNDIDTTTTTSTKASVTQKRKSDLLLSTNIVKKIKL